MLLVVIFCLLVCIHAKKDNGTQGALSLPNPRACANRIKHAEFNGHNYLFSNQGLLLYQGPEGGLGLYREENEFIKKRMINGLIRFFWRSGRKCNFDGCDRENLLTTSPV